MSINEIFVGSYSILNGSKSRGDRVWWQFTVAGYSRCHVEGYRPLEEGKVFLKFLESGSGALAVYIDTVGYGGKWYPATEWRKSPGGHARPDSVFARRLNEENVSVNKN